MIARFHLLALLLLPSAVLALDGHVIDRATGAPLQGVFVIARWQGNASVAVQPATRCYRAHLSVTDERGRFHVAELSGSLNPLLSGRRRVLSFYKPGYREIARQMPGEDRIVLERRDAVASERDFVEVSEVDVVGDCDLAERDRLELLKAKAAEMTSFAATPRQREIAYGTQYTIDLIEHGERTARRNLDQRLFGRKP